MTRLILKRNLTLSVFSFFALHSLAYTHDWYRSLAWIDIPVHFLAGILTAAVFYWFFQMFPSHFDPARNFVITLILVLGWAALVGVAWEFTEFIYDWLVITYVFPWQPLQFGLKDTIGDLLFDLLGALTLAVFVRLRYHK
ncbi:MAG: hypothetical protein A2Y84_02175 [Candidatus Colwellbacteria bacterium RBG_13_48_8]|uniref:VanZ-like domain-containing protein n=1 Tax=Candidatus Colwellbacteria bacterium RBG_13_48_8 TaxID=1797685 RepID=A0A1G1YXE5_9BACT|nr:MAG: hypothetical protein A2Y84_02175 [Candidatus Colwellbacteria bacterium RBG_13_48_8]